MNKIDITDRKVSIQLPLSGHSFSADNLAAELRDGQTPVEAILPRAKTLLVPEEEFAETMVETYLSAAGMACKPEECCVCTPAYNGIVAVMAVEKTVHDTLQEAFGSRLFYTTPLLTPCSSIRGTVLQRMDNLLFARIYENGLQFAEVLPLQNEADLHYHLSMLDSVYNIYSAEALILGNATGLIGVCKPLFKRLTCE